MKHTTSKDKISKNIFSLIPGNVYWKDTNGKYVDCNLTLTRIFGFNLTLEIIGKTDRELIPEIKYVNLIEKIDENIFSTNKTFFGEEIGLDIHGNQAIYLTKKIPLHNNKGKIIGLVGNSIDITERKKFEEQLSITKKISIADLKTKKITGTSHDEKSIFLKEALKDIKQTRYYLTGKYGGIYLTSREAQCLLCITRGQTAKEMGKFLNLSYRTIETHVDNIKSKLNCSSRSGLIRIAIENRFLDGV